jgi:hypothetical protein
MARFSVGDLGRVPGRQISMPRKKTREQPKLSTLDRLKAELNVPHITKSASEAFARMKAEKRNRHA